MHQCQLVTYIHLIQFHVPNVITNRRIVRRWRIQQYHEYSMDDYICVQLVSKYMLLD